MQAPLPAAEWCQLGFDVGAWLADAALAVLAESGVSRSEVAAIGSHGHTLWHKPMRSTWQIGEAAVIAERTGLDVVSDFRVGMSRQVAKAHRSFPWLTLCCSRRPRDGAHSRISVGSAMCQ